MSAAEFVLIAAAIAWSAASPAGVSSASSKTAMIAAIRCVLLERSAATARLGATDRAQPRVLSCRIASRNTSQVSGCNAQSVFFLTWGGSLSQVSNTACACSGLVADHGDDRRKRLQPGGVRTRLRSNHATSLAFRTSRSPFCLANARRDGSNWRGVSSLRRRLIDLDASEPRNSCPLLTCGSTTRKYGESESWGLMPSTAEFRRR